MTKKQRMALMGGTMGTLLVLALVAARVSQWRTVRSMEQDSPAASVRLTPLPDSGTLPETAGDSFSAFGWKFALPGARIVSEQALGSATSVDLDDGTRLVVFKTMGTTSHYNELKAALEEPLPPASLLSTPQSLEQQRKLLMRRMDAAGTARAVHPIAFGKVRGFQFLGVGAGDAETLDLYDSQDHGVTLLVRPGKRASQRWINTFAGSIQPPA